MLNRAIRLLRHGLCVAALTALTGAPAFAGGNLMTTNDVGDMSGFYIGINGGGGFGTSNLTGTNNGATTGDFSVSGGLAGITGGFNYQQGPWLLGVEGDGDWADVTGSAPCPAGGFTCQTKNSWLATGRVRVGYQTFYNIVPYITGGLAAGDIEANIPGFGSQTKTEVGWTVGAGLEVPLTDAISVKAEYLYVDLGKMTCDIPNCSPTTPVDVSFHENVVRAGLNIRF